MSSSEVVVAGPLHVERAPGLSLLDAYERLRRVRAAERPILFDDPGGQWGAIALEPAARLTLRERWRYTSAERTRDLSTPRALRALRDELATWRLPATPGLAFPGGWAGWVGYEFAHELERLPPRPGEEPPRADLAFCRASVTPTKDGVLLAVLDHDAAEARGRLARLRRDLAREPPTPPSAAGPTERAAAPGAPRSSFTRPAFEDAVRRALGLIREGHLYQVNLAQRFTGPLPADAWDAYRAARARNPSPFMGFHPGPGWSVACNSPERLLTVRGDEAFTSPIAGTRPRGATPAGDAAQEADLRASAKEGAEHVMLVDLERNDLGKVCAYGSVAVAPREFRTVERYSHVMHLVSHVRGRLAPARDALDALLALFPGGTITGVPKVRACEAIADLEPVPRGPYTGAMGTLGVDGNADWNLLIRTLTAVGPRGHVAVGAGIVADSDPEREYRETLAKGRHWFEVLGWHAPA